MITLDDVQKFCTRQDDCFDCPIFDYESGECVLTGDCKPGDWDSEDIEERILPKFKPALFDALKEVQTYCKRIGIGCGAGCPLWKRSTGCIIKDIPERWKL